MNDLKSPLSLASANCTSSPKFRTWNVPGSSLLICVPGSVWVGPFWYWSGGMIGLSGLACVMNPVIIAASFLRTISASVYCSNS